MPQPFADFAGGGALAVLGLAAVDDDYEQDALVSREAIASAWRQAFVALDDVAVLQHEGESGDSGDNAGQVSFSGGGDHVSSAVLTDD